MKVDKEKINIYQFSDEAIRAHLGINDDLDKSLNKELSRSQMRLSVNTPDGTIEIVNQTFADLRNFFRKIWIECYDMYIAERYYLDRNEMQRRRRIVDKDVSDWFYDAQPEIDWAAQELTSEQKQTRYLFLAMIAKKLMTPNIAQELIDCMPKTVEGKLMKNRETRIATGSIVTKDARILELIAEAQTRTNIIIRAQLRKFTKEEVEIVEKDFLSTHLTAFDLDTITEVPKQESIEETPYWLEKVTIYKPEAFLWEEHYDSFYGNCPLSRRYENIELWFNSAWAVSRKGYEYTNDVDRVEQFDITNGGYLWAPLVDNHDFPLEKPLYSEKVRLGTVILPRYQVERKRFNWRINRFFYLMDTACVKDAIEKKDLTVLQERGRFLSAENIEGCILFAKEQNADECLAWLESQFDAIMAAKNALIEEPYGYLEYLQDNKSLIACAEEWMNTYDDILEKDPDIQIEGKTFVTSGVHSLCKDYWDQGLFDLDKKIEEKGGKVRQKISGVTDYLIVDPSEAGESKSKTVREKKSQGKPIKLVLVQDMERALGLKSVEELEREKAFLYGLISDKKKAELKKNAVERSDDYLKDLQNNEPLQEWAAKWMKAHGDLLEENPEIVVEGKSFALLDLSFFDGLEIDTEISNKGGESHGKITELTDYVIVDPIEIETDLNMVREMKNRGIPIKLVLVQDMKMALGIEPRKKLLREKGFLFGLISEEKKAELNKEAEECDEDFDDFFDLDPSDDQDDDDELFFDDFNLDD